MIEPLWVHEALVMALHDDQISSFGGSYGIRDQNLLSASLARPRHLFRYEQPSIFDLGAAYGFAIAKNHPFVDGNRQTTLFTMAIFVELNGYEFKASEFDAVVVMEHLADGQADQDRIAQWLRKNSVKLA